MPHAHLIACIAVVSGLVSSAIVAVDLWRRPQPMRIMNAVWVLTPLWSSLLGLAAYFSFGRATKPRTDSRQRTETEQSIEPEAPGPNTESPMQMPMTDDTMHQADRAEHARMTDNGMELRMPMSPMPDKGMEMMMSDENMEHMGMHPRWQSVVLSTLHCGAGCTLADLIGEWLLFFIPVAIGGSLLAGAWVTDYLLALLIGIGFQYAAIRGMERIPRGEAVIRAAKADFFSLTAWQAGMYGWMAIVVFGFGDGVMASRTTFRFWFMMQAAMCCGFLVSLPVNVLLIRKGIKKGM